VSRDVALKYLHRDTIVLADAPKGFVLVCYENHPLGFVKNLGNRCNSLHPQGRRIRMDINL
jgi:NOL1/NOP2/fmu family ribosome biogenesis protein